MTDDAGNAMVYATSHVKLVMPIVSKFLN
jgi:hypothetical protein